MLKLYIDIIYTVVDNRIDFYDGLVSILFGSIMNYCDFFLKSSFSLFLNAISSFFLLIYYSIYVIYLILFSKSSFNL